MKNYDEHPVFLKSMRVKKLLSISEDDPSGQLKVMCSLSQFVVLLTLWGGGADTVDDDCC